jgi:Skp family chaperone for outer membrane proteins
VRHTPLTASIRRILPALFMATSLLLPGASALAQSQDYFVPGQARPAARPAPARPAPAPRPVAPVVAGAPDAGPPPLQVPMPPVPDLPALPKGASPPAAVMGVIGVSDVMRGSVAAQDVEKVIGERQQKWKDDVEKERAVWLEMQQAITAESGKLTPEQVRTRNRQLQERIIGAERKLNERKRIIDAATDYALNQIRSELIAVIRQVSESHGMNLLLHRTQVALNVNEFDITDQVTEQLNKLLPSVKILADGEEPPTAAAAVPPPPPAPPPAPTKK